jgi:hypothetical protein
LNTSDFPSLSNGDPSLGVFRAFQSGQSRGGNSGFRVGKKILGNGHGMGDRGEPHRRRGCIANGYPLNEEGVECGKRNTRSVPPSHEPLAH